MCDAIYKDKTQQKFNKITDDHFSDVRCLLKNIQKYDSFAAHFEQQFKYTIPHTELCKCMPFKVVKHLNSIGTMKQIVKPRCNRFTEEILTILKRLRNKRVTLVNKNSEIYEAC